MDARIANVIRTHWLVFLVVFGLGLVYSSHHFFIPLLLDPVEGVYNPLPQQGYGDEVLLYGARSHAVFEDFGIRGDFSLAEYPTSPVFLPILPPLLLGGLGKLFGSFEYGIIASDFIFPSLIFLVLYLLMREIGIEKRVSLLFIALFSLSPQFGISSPPISFTHIKTLAQTVFPYLAKHEILYFSHFDEPKLTFLFFSFFIYALARALKRNGRNDTILAGISFGILFYTYLYDWATMMTSLGILGMFFFITKDYRRLRIVAAIGGIGIVISSYYWINLLMLQHLSSADDVIARLGGEFSHNVRFATVWKSYIRAISLVALLWFFLRHRAKEGIIVLSAILLSYLVVVNEQVITGFNVEPDHWYRIQFLPISMSVFLLCYALYRQYGEVYIKKYASTIFVIFFIYFFGSAFAGQYIYAQSQANIFITSRSYQESFEWLNGHTEPGSVVGTVSFSGNLHLQMHTANKIFVPFGLSTVASEDELWKRFMIMARLFNVNTNTFASLISKESVAYYLFGDQYGSRTFDAAFFFHKWRIPDSLLAEKIKIYEKSFGNEHTLLSLYRLDYLFVDQKEFPNWSKPSHDLFGPLTEVFDNGRVVIYSFK
ncbi:MAG: hypothetical protein AAB972_03735 [Patescibacteria group bacterium]